MEFQRVHEFLSRLRPEFEPRRAHLLARRRVPISEVLTEVRAEETRLCSTGLLAVPNVLAAQALVSSAPPLLPTPLGGGRASSLFRWASSFRSGTPSLPHFLWSLQEAGAPRV